MTDQVTTGSYLIRIYRVDPEDDRKITGLVEVMDGSGERRPFTDLDQLAAVLKPRSSGKRPRRKIATGPKLG